MFKPNEQPELTGLDLPLLVPIWPRRKMLSTLLEMLIRGEEVTIDTFHILIGSHELRKLISDLADLGWPINSRDMKSAPTKLMPIRKIALYVLQFDKIDFTKVVRP